MWLLPWLALACLKKSKNCFRPSTTCQTWSSMWLIIVLLCSVPPKLQIIAWFWSRGGVCWVCVDHSCQVPVYSIPCIVSIQFLLFFLQEVKRQLLHSRCKLQVRLHFAAASAKHFLTLVRVCFCAFPLLISHFALLKCLQDSNGICSPAQKKTKNKKKNVLASFPFCVYFILSSVAFLRQCLHITQICMTINNVQGILFCDRKQGVMHGSTELLKDEFNVFFF